MRKYWIFALILAVFLTGCSQKQMKLALPFSAEEIVGLTVYHYDCGPTELEKKIVTRQEDLRAVYEHFDGQQIRLEALEPVEGGACTGFLFSLADGTEYELVHMSYGVKKGRLSSPALSAVYTTQSDNEWWWSHLDYEAVSVTEDDLP